MMCCSVIAGDLPDGQLDGSPSLGIHDRQPGQKNREAEPNGQARHCLDGRLKGNPDDGILVRSVPWTWPSERMSCCKRRRMTARAYVLDVLCFVSMGLSTVYVFAVAEDG